MTRPTWAASPSARTSTVVGASVPTTGDEAPGADRTFSTSSWGTPTTDHGEPGTGPGTGTTVVVGAVVVVDVAAAVVVVAVGGRVVVDSPGTGITVVDDAGSVTSPTIVDEDDGEGAVVEATSPASAHPASMAATAAIATTVRSTSTTSRDIVSRPDRRLQWSARDPELRGPVRPAQMAQHENGRR